MTANSSVYQFALLKQPACDHLSQVYQISYHLTDLKEAMEELLFILRIFLKSTHNKLDKNIIPSGDLLALNITQTEAIETLRKTADKIESYKGYQAYSDALARVEVKNAQ